MLKFKTASGSSPWPVQPTDFNVPQTGATVLLENASSGQINSDQPRGHELPEGEPLRLGIEVGFHLFCTCKYCTDVCVFHCMHDSVSMQHAGLETCSPGLCTRSHVAYAYEGRWSP
jgi:hypothetical protein